MIRHAVKSTDLAFPINSIAMWKGCFFIQQWECLADRVASLGHGEPVEANSRLSFRRRRTGFEE
jgi:hypothetical protein